MQAFVGMMLGAVLVASIPRFDPDIDGGEWSPAQQSNDRQLGGCRHRLAGAQALKTRAHDGWVKISSN
jgi:hypothetical protein